MNNPDYITIPLSVGQETVIDNIDSDLLEIKWYARKWKSGYYAATNVKGGDITTCLHRRILGRMIGRELKITEKVDHIDTDSLNNRRANLRLATISQNNANRKRPKNNTSGYKGVYWDKKSEKWAAMISVDGRLRRLGSFDDPKDAYEAYCTAAKEYHGEFARLD